MIRKLLFFVIILFLTPCYLLGGEIAFSPNKQLKLSLQLNQNGLSYSIKHNKTIIINNAPLGIEVNNVVYSKGCKLKLKQKSRIKEQYSLLGNIVKSDCNEYSYVIDSACKFTLQVRLFNDGVAYRYLIKNDGWAVINRELSGFNFPTNSKVWYFERNNQWKLKTYAGEWLNTNSDSLHIISKMGPVQGIPLVAELHGKAGYVAIAEAGLYNYSGMRLEAYKGGCLLANFTENNGFSVRDKIITPWRVVTYAETLNGLINCNIITSLNPPASKVLFADTDWIKPGRSVWSWWSCSENKDYMTVESEKRFIDYANKLSFEYTLIDEGWETKWHNKWESLTEICEYAADRKVGVWVWKHWNQLNNPDNKYQQLANFLDSIKSVGCVGIKVDFLNGEAQPMVEFQEALYRLAAEHKILVNIHGCGKPTGEERTYPNELTREAVRGLELNKMNQHITASHNASLPFTRCLLQQCDYTPLGFSNPGNTTWAHQLATAYVFTSPLLVMAENPDFLFSEIKLQPVIPFIKSLPTVWDETRVLKESKIGKLAVLARKKESTWYLVVLNAGKATQLTLKLDFSGFKINKLQEISDDSENPKSVNASNIELRKEELLEVNLAENGGYVARIVEK